MTVDAWLAAAQEDARQRGLPELVPLLAGLATSMAALRHADDDHRSAPLPDQPKAQEP